MITSTLVWPLLASAVVAAPRGDSLSSSRTSLVVKRGLQKRGDKTGYASASWNNNVELLTQINVAGNNYSVVLDTGSADAWLFCTEGDDKMETGRAVYNPKTGYKFPDASTFNVKYGAGYAKGNMYADKMTIGGITVDQSIGCATDVDSDDVNDRNLDGLIGLGFDSGCVLPHDGRDAQEQAKKNPLNSVTRFKGGILGPIYKLLKITEPNAQLTWTEQAFPQMKEGLFTVDIKQGADGVYNFGYVDSERFSTQLTYMPVVSWNQWIVKMSGYQVGKNGTKRDAERKALIDTGTTNILIDEAPAKEYYAAVPKANTTDSKTWYVPCKPEDANMPDFHVTFSPPKAEGSTHYPAGKGGSSTNEYQAVIPGNYLIGTPSGKNDGMCAGSITTSDKGNGWDVILGDVFIMSQLVVFDLGNDNGSTDKDLPTKGQIGFAQKP